MPNLLSVEELHVSFESDEGVARAVRGVSFSVEPQKTLGIVGESGCGKSVSALSALRLIPQPPGKIGPGRIVFNNRELLGLSEAEMRSIRGKDISMIFQDPMTSLNPVYTCGSQIEEALRLHKGATKSDAHAQAIDMLARVGIPTPSRTADSYPHQLSGGMRQRVMIAMALCCSPQLLIADEPTTALDVTVQATILDLLQHLQESLRMSMIIISHDLGIVSDMAHDILVMYAGETAEQAPAADIFSNPLHPYTQALLQTIPSLTGDRNRLTVIPGEVPNPLHIPEGCPFHPRCAKVMDRCKSEHPPLFRTETSHPVRCFLYE